MLTDADSGAMLHCKLDENKAENYGPNKMVFNCAKNVQSDSCIMHTHVTNQS